MQFWRAIALAGVALAWASGVWAQQSVNQAMPAGVTYATADVYMELDFKPATLLLSAVSARS